MVSNFRSTAAIAIGFDLNASKSIPDVNSSIIFTPSRMSRRACPGDLKDNDGFPLGARLHFVLQHTLFREIDRHSENIRDLQADPG